MKKNLLLTILLIFFSISMFAKQVDEVAAKKAGQSFLLYSTNTLKTSINLELAYSYRSNSNIAVSQTITCFYIFNDGKNGFIIVAGDDNVTPILGYSNEGTFDSQNIPPSVQKWLEGYKNQILYVVENNIESTDEIKKAWDELLNPKPTAFKANNAVAPLVATKWNQAPYYNALCPGNTVTGCVATAMAQIMKYWNYPETGTGFHSYNHQTYGTLSANFGSTTYQWSSMPNVVNSSNNAVATLMYQVGVSVDMGYGPAETGGSSAYMLSAYSPIQHCSEYALKNYFGYKTSMQGLGRSNYGDAQWLNLLKTEFNASRPVLYAGFGSGGGHCFVADGYDNNNYIHFNWGWGGNSDGYFQINALNPGSIGPGGGSGGFNSGHQALIGLEPSSGGGGGGGGGGSQNYDLQLYSNIYMPSTQIWFTTSFNLSVDIANFGTENFVGDYGVAIFDYNLNFVGFMDIKSNMVLEPNYYSSLNFSNSGSASFVPGIYYSAIFYRTATLDWTIVGDGSYNNIQQFEVYYYSDIETNSAFTISTNNGKFIQGNTTTVNVDVLNTGSYTFYGQIRVSLADLNGNYIQSIQILNENNGLPHNYHYTNGLDFTGEITAAPGTYLLEVGYKEQGSSYWYYAGSANYSNPIYVIVEAADLTPDQYESNNTLATAYNLPVNFSGDIATCNTEGSNLHVSTDNDYYKIVLPAGYSYTIGARLHDSYNSGNGKFYTVDALYTYSIDGGSTWSSVYDDVLHQSIIVHNTGTVIFHVAPYFSGSNGTYLLELAIYKAALGIEEQTSNSELIKIYPNPAKDFVNIDMEEFAGKVSKINIYSVHGQLISSINAQNEKSLEILLQNLSDGLYFIQLQTSQGIITKKIIVTQ